LDCSSPAVPLLSALVFTKAPYEARAFPIVVTFMTLHRDLAARRSAGVVGAKRSELATGVYNGVPMAGTVAAVAYETASVDRADDRLRNGDRPALAARDRRERR
jgi:hypothetical protein